MKTYIYILLLIIGTSLFAQQSKEFRIPSLNETAPSFKAQSTMGDINFPDDYFNKWKIIFSHPADFTPVCTSEIWELAQSQEDFAKLNTKILVISTDGINSHIEWVKSLESMEYKNRRPVKINFPLISDVNMSISKLYGMQHPYMNSTLNVRGVFIISPDNHIQFIAFYPSNIGRNIDEIKRTLTALQESYSKNVMTPVNWQKGDDYLIPPPKSIKESEKFAGKNDSDFYSYTWYMWFKKNK